MPATLPEIIAILREFLRDEQAEITRSTRFDDLLGMDSMDLVSIVVEAECRYDLLFDLPEIDRIETVGDLIHMIDHKQALAAAA